MENVLLTGATGFVGRNLIKILINLGYNVRCIVMNKKHHWKLIFLSNKTDIGKM